MRVIFKDTHDSNWSWDNVARRYYWHRFYSHQPDLNYDNPASYKAEILKVIAFWLDKGIDGFRVDAIPYLFEPRRNNLARTCPRRTDFAKRYGVSWMRTFRAHYFLAEANMWPQDLIPYFGSGDEFHMAFNFPIMPRIFPAAHAGAMLADHRNNGSIACHSGHVPVGFIFSGTTTN